MHFYDYLIIAAYFVFSVGIALYYSRRASKNTDEFFLSGRNLPWYLAGLSMVATTFAADTPLAITELVAKNGIAGNLIFGIVLVYSILFGTGSLIFGDITSALIYIFAAIVSIRIIYKNLQHVGWTKLIN